MKTITARLLAGSTAIAAVATFAAAANAADTVRIAINQSPWLDSFIEMVDLYESETGNTVELDVVPFTGLLEKIRNSLRAADGDYDIVNVNALWLPEIYSAGYLKPLAEIREGYKLGDGTLSYGGTTYWDSTTGTFSEDGELLGVPLNGNVQVLYYNSEIYDRLNLEVPQDWDGLIANAKAIQAEGDAYGFVPRAARGSIVYNFTPYAYTQNGAYVTVKGDKSVEVSINSPEVLKALEVYLTLANEAGPPNPGAIAQGEMIQLMSTGRGAQTIGVIAAWGSFENPNESRVAGKIEATLIPAGPTGTRASSAGHWVAGIAGNVSPERQDAALDFLDWFQGLDVQTAYVRAGGVPVRGDLGKTDLGQSEEFRFIEAYSENAANAVMALPFPQANEVSDALALRLNQAVIGELEPAAALNDAADAIAEIFEREGYDVSRLPAL